MTHPIRCAHCLKAMRWRVNPPEIIFWRPGEKPYGIHDRCRNAYNGTEEPCDSPSPS